MNPLLLALKDGPRSYQELRKIPNIDSLLRLARKNLEVILIPGSPVRFALFQRDVEPAKDPPLPRSRPKRTLTLDGPTKVCKGCGESKRIANFRWNRIIEGRKKRKTFCYSCEWKRQKEAA